MPLQQRQQLRAVNGAVNAWNVGGALPLRAVPDRNLHPIQNDEAARPPVDENHAEDVVDADEVAFECCLPSGCPHQKEPILPSDPGDAVRVVCNNDGCSISRWMHADCFQEWEEHVLSYLRSCGRARSWSEKQRLQNLWTKKGYDLAFKACDCRCGKGHLRKDLDYLPLPKKTEDRRPKKRGRTKPMNSPGAKVPAQLQHPLTEGSSMVRAPLRVRTSSLCSTGSSPPSSDGTPPLTPGSAPARSSGGRFDFFADAEQAAAGNIFWRRTDLSAFTSLPRHLQNPYQIKIEDEGPHGNDETRSFILTQLSGHKVTVVHCAICQMDLPVYDKYPLIDGTFFLSPHQYSPANITVTLDRRPRAFLNAICMRCLDGGGGSGGFALRCLACKTPWSGATLVIGTMYAYDVFAALPCCSARLACKLCRCQVLEPGAAYPFFSDYSRLVKCHSCGSEDYHFIKPLGATFFRSSERLF